MYRQIKYLLVEMKPALKISKIIQMNFSTIGVESVVTDDKRLVTVDWLDTILAEFTGKFDKQGLELFSGDIVELDQEGIDDLKANFGMAENGLIPGIYIIGWAQGGFNATHLKEQKGFFIFEEPIVMRLKKLGNQFENVQIILDYVKPLAEEKMEGTEGDINAAPAPEEQKQ